MYILTVYYYYYFLEKYLSALGGKSTKSYWRAIGSVLASNVGKGSWGFEFFISNPLMRQNSGDEGLAPVLNPRRRFRTGSFSVVAGAVLCFVAYLAASLASSYLMPGAAPTPSPDNQRCLQTLLCIPMEIVLWGLANKNTGHAVKSEF